MSSNASGSSSENTTRKQRRAAERAARKSGGGKASSTGSGGESGGSGRSPMLLITVGAIAIGLVAVVALILASGGMGNEAAAVSEPDGPAPAEELRNGRSLGDADAPVTIDVWEDPQCGHCATFTERTEPLIIAEYVTDGTASFTYHDYTFMGQESWAAAAAMRVAEAMDGKFWDYHNVLFHNQDGIDQGAYSRERLADMAELVGLDRDEFLHQMDDPAYLEAVEDEVAIGTELTVNSTPTLIINGEILRGVPSWTDLVAVIEAAAADAQGQG